MTRAAALNPEFGGLDVVDTRSTRLGLHDKFNFGKHNGSTVLEVLEIDPGYVEWASLNVDRISFAKEVHDYLACVEDDELCEPVDRWFKDN